MLILDIVLSGLKKVKYDLIFNWIVLMGILVVTYYLYSRVEKKRNQANQEIKEMIANKKV